MKKKDVAPRVYAGPRNRGSKGLLIVYTGHGKGKTTAGMGTVLRALGRGYNVAIVQFMKGRWSSGEIQALKKFSKQITYFAVGEGFTWETKSLDKDIALATKAWAHCRQLIQEKKHDVYFFDEILYALKYQFLKTADVISGLKKRNSKAHVILTGRDAPKALIAMADIVTEMKAIKHPFHKGFLAQPGIDY